LQPHTMSASGVSGDGSGGGAGASSSSSKKHIPKLSQTKLPFSPRLHSRASVEADHRAASKGAGAKRKKPAATPGKKGPLYAIPKPGSGYVFFCANARHQVDAAKRSGEAPSMPSRSSAGDTIGLPLPFAIPSTPFAASKDLLRFLGEQWNRMTDEQKRPYNEAANTAREAWLAKMTALGGEAAETAAHIRNPKKRKSTPKKSSSCPPPDEADSEPNTARSSHSSKKKECFGVSRGSGAGMGALPSALPQSRVRKLMQEDRDVNLISKEAAAIATKATDLFVGWLARRVHQVAQHRSRKLPVIAPQDIDDCIASTAQLRFLRPVFSATALAERSSAANSSSEDEARAGGGTGQPIGRAAAAEQRGRGGGGRRI